MKKFAHKISIKDVMVLLLVIAKFLFFYYLIGITNLSLALGLITFTYFGIIFTLFLFSHNKNNTRWFIIVYSILTFLMFADCAYYSYFNQLVSVNQVAQMNSLIVVDESVKVATPPIGIVLFLDIPILYLYFKDIKKRIELYHVLKFKPYKKVIVSLFMAAILLLSLNPLNADAVKALKHTEFITYHVSDVFKQIFGENDNQINSEEELNVFMEEVKERKPGTYELNSIAKGRNLIVIQVESFQDFLIGREYNGQELTPHLNKLINNDTLYFDHYYQSIGKGNTSDAEFTTQNSVYPVIKGESYRLFEENSFYGLPWIMKENGYKTLAFHGYKGEFWNREYAYPNQGFEDYISMEDMEVTEKIGLGISDTEMFRQTADYLEKLQQPFYSFIITLTNHHPYEIPEQYRSIELEEKHIGTIFGNYLQATNYTDQAIGEFIEQLKEKGLYDNSIIAIYGDHHGLNCKDDAINEDMSEFLGFNYDYDEMLNIPLLIHIPEGNVTRQISTVGGQVDFMPTITNLLGVEVNNPYVLGQDIVNAKEGYVASVTYMLRGSFFKDNALFEISRENVFDLSRAWNPNTQETLPLEDFEKDYIRALKLLDASKYILENNLIENKLENE